MSAWTKAVGLLFGHIAHYVSVATFSISFLALPRCAVLKILTIFLNMVETTTFHFEGTKEVVPRVPKRAGMASNHWGVIIGLRVHLCSGTRPAPRSQYSDKPANQCLSMAKANHDSAHQQWQTFPTKIKCF
ncbi:hypothetical protein BRADI_1g28935v3 [Brachypodium distachyon]|uniref:Uncharacterized protein n=1 Tax=Brachypodium distachyon TaxID=15368 RepID=A0A2K2DLS7_BRADI|nr:hypothetical protein BRADI_1g28935v3 [Brachypodium distachyon]